MGYYDQTPRKHLTVVIDDENTHIPLPFPVSFRRLRFSSIITDKIISNFLTFRAKLAGHCSTIGPSCHLRLFHHFGIRTAECSTLYRAQNSN